MKNSNQLWFEVYLSLIAQDSIELSKIASKSFRVFCLDMPRKENVGNINNADPVYEQNTPLDLPFEWCFFEGVSNKVLVDFPSTNSEIASLIVMELFPNEYAIDAIIHQNGKFFQQELEQTHGRHLVRHIIEFINNTKENITGISKINRKQRLGKGKNRTIVKVKNVVVVSSKNHTSKPNLIYGKKIDWKQRWQVRGHWRKVSGIGKDRYGKYHVKGFTWVKAFTKGPETKDLIQKVYVKKSP